MWLKKMSSDNYIIRTIKIAIFLNDIVSLIIIRTDKECSRIIKMNKFLLKTKCYGATWEHREIEEW